MTIEISQIQESKYSALYDCSIQYLKNRKCYLTEQIIIKLCAQIIKTYTSNLFRQPTNILYTKGNNIHEISSSDIITADICQSSKNPKYFVCHLHANGRLFYSAYSRVTKNG